MKKRMLAAVLLAVSMVGAFCLSSCGNYSETFTGTLSAGSYATTTEATNAFLVNEINGNTTKAVLSGYEKTSDLTAEEIAALPLGDVKAEDVEAAEKGVISYSVSGADISVAPLSAAAVNVEQHEITLLKINGVYRYFVPATTTGEMITRSYFDDVLDSTKYANCTITYSMAEKVTAQMDGETQSMTVNMKLSMKLTESAVYYELSTSGLAQVGGEDMKVSCYVLDNGNGLYGYSQSNGSWTSARLSEYSSLSDLSSMQYEDWMDHTYFEKTNSGFALTQEKFESYMEHVVGLSGLTGLNLKGEATYFVTEGHVSKATVKLSMSGTMSVMGYTVSYKASASGQMKYAAFGTTTVEIPADLQAYIG